ncbi:hypothetical protein H109_07993 [Trichophyton interdigitale MR816]|uniref:Uncharacterized protein n=1 Tax=Trichophyton interdigitale (strain MR816) TaxID=1215338 RepID=A0A059IXU2_TRIIM|nr:hypothetical protein H109_07993 [Trichophyton interdigitale MR816]
MAGGNSRSASSQQPAASIQAVRFCQGTPFRDTPAPPTSSPIKDLMCHDAVRSYITLLPASFPLPLEMLVTSCICEHNSWFVQEINLHIINESGEIAGSKQADVDEREEEDVRRRSSYSAPSDHLAFIFCLSLDKTDA